MELESWLDPETYLTSLTRSFFSGIGKVLMAFSPVGCSEKQLTTTVPTIGQWEFKFVFFKGLFKNH